MVHAAAAPAADAVGSSFERLKRYATAAWCPERVQPGLAVTEEDRCSGRTPEILALAAEYPQAVDSSSPPRKPPRHLHAQREASRLAAAVAAWWSEIGMPDHSAVSKLHVPPSLKEDQGLPCTPGFKVRY